MATVTPTAGGAAPLPALRTGGFLQPTRAAFWLYIALFVFFAPQILTHFRGPPAGVAIAVGVWTLWLLPVAWFIQRLDLFEPEPWSLRLAAFGWGAVVAIGAAGEANTDGAGILGKLAPDAVGWRAALLGPTTEEILKALAVVMIVLIARHQFDRLMDGLIYGALAGLGFEYVENIGYTVQGMMANPEAGYLATALQFFGIRGVLTGLWSHAAYTGLVGIGIAYFVTKPEKPLARRLTVLVGMFAISYTGHFLNNASSQIGPFIGLILNVLIGVTVLVLAVKWARRTEYRWFSKVMTGDMESDVITSVEAHSLSTLRRRRKARRLARRISGPAGGKLVGQLQRAQSAYAVAKDRGREDVEAAMRQRIHAIRTQLAGLGAATAR